jgi:dihydrolipoyl dehydrogenase
LAYDVAIIGGGPAGYVAAIRAAQLGMKVCCIEDRKYCGGTCLNVGCIPSKALLYSSELFATLRDHGAHHGIECDNLHMNFDQMMERKTKVVETLGRGIDALFGKNKVTRIQGKGRLTGPNTIAVGDETVEAKHILLATGSEPIPLPFLPFDEKVIVSSTGALSLPKVPERLILVGAGVIGLELGSVYRRLGSEVTVIEFLDHICPSLDGTLSKAFQKELTNQGMTFHLSSMVKSGEVTATGAKLEVENAGSFEADVVLVGIGRRPYSEGLGLRELGIAQDDKGRVLVDGYFRTNLPHIYAVGDLINGPMLAHKAEEEGLAAIDLIAGKTPHINYLAIPNVVYTDPEVASVGMTEEQAKEAGLPIKTGSFPIKANSRARATEHDAGLVKIIAHEPTDRLIGMHIMSAHASELISEGVVAIEAGMTVSELAHLSHAHPTYTEALKEACLAVSKSAIHI